jgi:hypothetical protein
VPAVDAADYAPSLCPVERVAAKTPQRSVRVNFEPERD